MATISFTTKFDLSLSPKQFKFTDTTDWAGQGIALTNVNGNFRITSPSGAVIYNNTNFADGSCDIFLNSALTNQTTIQLPLGADGLPEPGVYTILYTVYNDSLLTYSTVTNTYTYAYERPEIAITQTVDCVSPLFTSIDATNYLVDGVTPSITRTHVLSFPVGSGLSAITTTAPTITAGKEEFANGTQTTQVTSVLTYVFSDGLTVKDSITGTEEILVDCTYICSIYCGIRSIEQQMVAAQTSNPSEYQRLTTLFTQIMGLAGLAKLAIECGKSSDVNGYMSLIQTLGNFTDDCSCSGDEPSLVQGLGGLITTAVVESGDAVVVVTASVAGSTTTYTVTLSPAFITKVNNAYNSIVAGTSKIDVAVVVNADGSKTYTVSIDADSFISGVNGSVTINAANGNKGTNIVLHTKTIVNTGTYEVKAFAGVTLYNDGGGASAATLSIRKNTVAQASCTQGINIVCQMPGHGDVLDVISCTAGDTVDFIVNYTDAAASASNYCLVSDACLVIEQKP